MKVVVVFEMAGVEEKGWPRQVGFEASPPSAESSRFVVELKADDLFFHLLFWSLSKSLILLTCLIIVQAFRFNLE